jgi:hypothetical protein
MECHHEAPLLDDLANADHLLVVVDGVNQAKGDNGPEAWKPPYTGDWCRYATVVVGGAAGSVRPQLAPPVDDARRARRSGAQFVSVHEAFDSLGPAGRLQRNILSAVAQYEREQMLERSRSGLRAKFQAGRWPGGPPPFGSRLDRLGRVDHSHLHLRASKAAPAQSASSNSSRWPALGDRSPNGLSTPCPSRPGDHDRLCTESTRTTAQTRVAAPPISAV